MKAMILHLGGEFCCFFEDVLFLEAIENVAGYPPGLDIDVLDADEIIRAFLLLVDVVDVQPFVFVDSAVYSLLDAELHALMI